jgi:hypothetical protein
MATTRRRSAVATNDDSHERTDLNLERVVGDVVQAEVGRRRRELVKELHTRRRTHVVVPGQKGCQRLNDTAWLVQGGLHTALGRGPHAHRCKLCFSGMPMVTSSVSSFCLPRVSLVHVPSRVDTKSEWKSESNSVQWRYSISRGSVTMAMSPSLPAAFHRRSATASTAPHQSENTAERRGLVRGAGRHEE